MWRMPDVSNLLKCGADVDAGVEGGIESANIDGLARVAEDFNKIGMAILSLV